MITKNDIFVLLYTTRYHIAVRVTRVCPILLLSKIKDLDPTGQKCGHMWENVGRIGDPYETGGQKPYGPHMGCSYGAHIVAQMGPRCGHVFVLTGFISRSLSKLNEDSSL